MIFTPPKKIFLEQNISSFLVFSTAPSQIAYDMGKFIFMQEVLHG